jgi:hypothetical protein
MRPVLAASAGFLLAVLWFDLMFDVQVLRQPEGPLPAAVLVSIASYYRRVTTEAVPMTHLVAAVMLVAVGGSVAEVLRGRIPLAFGAALVAACALPIGFTLMRVFPAAVRLGAQLDPPAVQSELARAICRDHLACFAAITAFLGLAIAAPEPGAR